MKRLSVVAGMLAASLPLYGAAADLPLTFNSEGARAKLAAREAWIALCVPDRMGVTGESTPHCQRHPGFTPDVAAYLDEFMRGKTGVAYTDVGCDTWNPWKTPQLTASIDSISALADAIAEDIDPRVAAAMSRIKDTDRKLLALRSYLRARSTIAQRWSWSTEQIAAFVKSPEHREINSEIERVRQAFVAANPGFDLWVNPDVRSLDTQLASWNGNASVSRAAANLLTTLQKWHDSAPVKAMLAAERQRAAERLLSNHVPTPTPTLAAPGLSAHGQMRAIDFQIKKAGKVVAGPQSARIGTDWDAAGWSEKLKTAVRVGSNRFSGPLESPREPWHYTYQPESP